METHRRPELKHTVIPIYPKPAPNEERILPLPQQLMEKMRKPEGGNGSGQ
jgi:hypothetical protein